MYSTKWTLAAVPKPWMGTPLRKMTFLRVGRLPCKALLQWFGQSFGVECCLWNVDVTSGCHPEPLWRSLLDSDSYCILDQWSTGTCPGLEWFINCPSVHQQRAREIFLSMCVHLSIWRGGWLWALVGWGGSMGGSCRDKGSSLKFGPNVLFLFTPSPFILFCLTGILWNSACPDISHSGHVATGLCEWHV